MAVIGDTFVEMERQMLKAYHRLTSQMEWETIYSMEFYTKLYNKVRYSNSFFLECR